jgi:hypothetical protein
MSLSTSNTVTMTRPQSGGFSLLCLPATAIPLLARIAEVERPLTCGGERCLDETRVGFGEGRIYSTVGYADAALA